MPRGRKPETEIGVTPAVEFVSEFASETGGENGGAGIENFEPHPADAITEPTEGGSATEPIKKRRGRPPGSTNKTGTTKGSAKAKSSVSEALKTDFCAAMLVNIHSIIAEATKIPEMDMQLAEATQVVQAGITLANEYDLTASSKQIAWCNFLFVFGTVYGTRILAFHKRTQKKKPVNVVPINREQTNGTTPQTT